MAFLNPYNIKLTNLEDFVKGDKWTMLMIWFILLLMLYWGRNYSLQIVIIYLCYFLILKNSCAYLKNKRREKLIDGLIPPVGSLPGDGARSHIWVAHVHGKGLNSCPNFLCFPRPSNGKLHQGPSSQVFLWLSNGMLASQTVVWQCPNASSYVLYSGFPLQHCTE